MAAYVFFRFQQLHLSTRRVHLYLTGRPVVQGRNCDISRPFQHLFSSQSGRAYFRYAYIAVFMGFLRL